jgi:signal transduction histidine kinase
VADLAQLTAAQLMAIGARLRRIAEGHAWTGDEITGAVTSALFDELGGIALARAYRSEGEALVLIASRGNEPAWNAVAASRAHRTLALAAAPRPLVVELVTRLRAGLAAPVLVADAAASPLVLDQREFVHRHAIRAAVAFGGALADGELLAFVLFLTVRVPDSIAGELDLLGLQARVALLDAIDRPIGHAEATARRAQALDDLLRLHEYRAQKLAEQLVLDRTAMQARAELLEQRSGSQAARDADRVRRGQRAMLNVIDDLREARTRLEARVAERTAALQDRNRELEQFAYIASHDLQEPLRTVTGYLQLIAQRYGDKLDGDGHEFIDFAVKGAARMQELIEALLSYSRVASREVSHISIALDDVVDDVLRGLDRAIQDARATIVRAPLPAVRGDRVQLGQLFQNLVANALKFRGDAPAHVEITAERTPGAHVITVADRGIGFDDRHAERIFAVFRRLQRKHPGTGIGLAICKKIVTRHGGTIRAESRPGQGARFQVSLPAGDDASA